ncbi:MAG: UDP-N-acetylenolpyruvoylglucosamine reductase [Candidatus Yanofskybacteria bacterium RIFCSPLOWO2_01_FULL_49_25]|uniref:UDP-N-acetylenolpyruvoylglucosamine reductase n=1 Tax=Candidatus Yanofskybacteria bacterium RIFCSPLOWO2_01_FULL_49_25 TaxID=1802701 RepID=A0A1F8GTM5_9BACT|nr:MAG: UDP-N-acetylenolpyruvoylglucosamine reductase [Candidatus Yanofskybacteria bacterium RIFCSPLOWO2_01_FULL_49_25]
MIDVRENISLKDFTTFHIGGPARFFVEVGTVDQLIEALEYANNRELPIFVMGGGSNLLVSDEGFDGLVIHPKFLGFKIVELENSKARVHVASGENWDFVVRRCVEAGLWGIENLSFVPGDAGGFVMQNVGAYGQQASDVTTSVDVYDIELKAKSYKLKAELGFGYRKSIFNTTHKGRYVILSVDILLSRGKVAYIEYPDVKRYMEEEGIAQPTLAQMREAITAIRTSKGFDPDQRWSAGSFFKNPILTPDQYSRVREKIAIKFGPAKTEQLDELKNKFTRNPQEIKIPAGFLMDTLLHMKGMRVGDAEISDKQVISIYNRGKATAKDVIALYSQVRKLVLDATGITLTHEPEFVGIEEE